MPSDETQLAQIMARALRLIKDEKYQSEMQRQIFENLHQTVGIDPMTREAGKRNDLERLGSIGAPIPVNGVYGELSYLSLLRTKSGAPFAFHRLGSSRTPLGLVADIYELLALDLSVRARLYFDIYNRNRSKQCPKGMMLANDFYNKNPIFGTSHNVASFPLGLSEIVREQQKEIYGWPFPVESLRQFEGVLSTNAEKLESLPMAPFPLHELSDQDETKLEFDDLLDRRLKASGTEYDEGLAAEKRRELRLAAERFRVALHHLRPLSPRTPPESDEAIWMPDNVAACCIALWRVTKDPDELHLASRAARLFRAEGSEKTRRNRRNILILLSDALMQSRLSKYAIEFDEMAKKFR
jgi:hypothetical protein